MRFYHATQLSEHMALTPEGFLIVYDVPIARTGEMEYGPDETPLECEEGETLVRVERHEEDVFAGEAMTSFEGKPITINHPGKDVTPANWGRLAKGHAQNVRRGEGVESELLLADLLITDEQAIGLVHGGLREVSCGYDVDYEQLGPGRGRQRNIQGNHIALVARGRCGSRCRINDNDEDIMNKNAKKSVLDRFLDVFKRPEVAKALDEAMAEDPAAPDPKGETKPETKPEAAPPTDEASAEERIAALESTMAEATLLLRQLVNKAEATPEGGEASDEAEVKPEEQKPTTTDKTKDAALARAKVVDADVKARAAILMPGLPVQDGDDACAVKRLALRTAAKDADLSKVVDAALRGSTIDKCDCVTLDAAFLAASEVARVRKNAATADGLTKATARDFGKPTTPADINRANREFHAKKGA